MTVGNKLLASALATMPLGTLVIAPAAEAYRTYTRVRTVPHYYYYQAPTWGQRHPVLKSTAIGGALGAGVGAIGGAIAGHGRVGRGALAGLGAGAGIGALHAHPALRNHPIARSVGEGTLAGLGIGIVAHGRHTALKGAGIGALIGGGLGLLRNSGGYF